MKVEFLASRTTRLESTHLKLFSSTDTAKSFHEQTPQSTRLCCLTTTFRNRAAHIDELGKEDYLGCRDLVIGDRGIVWRLLVATESHR